MKENVHGIYRFCELCWRQWALSRTLFLGFYLCAFVFLPVFVRSKGKRKGTWKKVWQRCFHWASMSVFSMVLLLWYMQLNRRLVMQELTTGKQKEFAIALRIRFFIYRNFSQMEKNGHILSTDTSAVVVFYKSLPRGCWKSFPMCILTVFQRRCFIFALWLLLSSGVEVNREGWKDWWKGFVQGGVFWLLLFHQLFETKIVAACSHLR